jgi:hypothetical protein
VSATPTTLRRDLALVAWQVRYEQRAFWRNRARAFFAFLMPIMFLVIFAAILGHTNISSRACVVAAARRVKQARGQLVVPGLPLAHESSFEAR